MMTSEFAAQFDRLQSVAGNMAALAKLVSQGARLVKQGDDETGRVTVVIDRAGLAETIRIRPDWRKVLEPDELPGAIGSAYGRALGQRLASPATDENDLSLDSEPISARQVITPAQLTATSVPPDRLSRSFDRLSSEAWDRIESIQRRAGGREEQPQGTGSAASGKVEITVRINLQLECWIDERWADQQSAAGLMNCLNPALQDARRSLAQFSESDRFPLQPQAADPLLGELLALLNDPQEFAEGIGGRVR